MCTHIHLYTATSISLYVVCMYIHVCVLCNIACDHTIHVCVFTDGVCSILWMTRVYDVVCMYGDDCTDTWIILYIDYRYIFVCIASWHAVYEYCLCRLSLIILLCRQTRDSIWWPSAWEVDKRAHTYHTINSRLWKMPHRYVSAIGYLKSSWPVPAAGTTIKLKNSYAQVQMTAYRWSLSRCWSHTCRGPWFCPRAVYRLVPWCSIFPNGRSSTGSEPMQKDHRCYDLDAAARRL